MSLQTGNVTARLAYAVLNFIIKTGLTRSSFKSSPSSIPHCFCLSSGSYSISCRDYYNNSLVYCVRMFFHKCSSRVVPLLKSLCSKQLANLLPMSTSRYVVCFRGSVQGVIFICFIYFVWF